MQYPTRCRIVDPDCEVVKTAEGEFALVAPDVSKPHERKTGTAYLCDDGRNVRIELDDGTTLMDYECWWEPISDAN